MIVIRARARDNSAAIYWGNVTIIVYGRSIHTYSLFQDVLKRSGAYENVVKFSHIGQIWLRKNIRIENLLHVLELRIHDVAMHRALKRYRHTLPAPKKRQVVRLLASVHCEYTVCTPAAVQYMQPIFCRILANFLMAGA